MCNGNRAEVVVGEYDFRFIPHAEDSFAAFNFIQREYISGWVKCNFDAFRKYKRSMLGILWSFLNPLLTMLVQYIVFSTLFQSDIPNIPLAARLSVVMSILPRPANVSLPSQ